MLYPSCGQEQKFPARVPGRGPRLSPHSPLDCCTEAAVMLPPSCGQEQGFGLPRSRLLPCCGHNSVNFLDCIDCPLLITNFLLIRLRLFS